MADQSFEKKQITVRLLELLKRFTDSEHTLSQSEILNLLKNVYHIELDRKTVKRNLICLNELDEHVNYSTKSRNNSKGDEKIEAWTDIYYEHEFNESELQLLISSVLFSKYIPYSYSMDLIGKLQQLASENFKVKLEDLGNNRDDWPVNNEFLLSMEVLQEAIKTNRKVTLNYNHYEIDKKMHPNLDKETGKPKVYKINPYSIVSTNGRFYLICNYDKYDEVSYYRLDRISGVKIIDGDDGHVKPENKVKWLENGLNLPARMTEQIYMYAGESGRVTFKIDIGMLSEVIDWFGKNIVFYDNNDKDVTVSVDVNFKAFNCWALQYARYIKILGPQKVVDTYKESLEMALNRINEDD